MRKQQSFKYCTEIAECLTAKHIFILTKPGHTDDLPHIGENYEAAFLLKLNSKVTLEDLKDVAKEWRSSRVPYFICSNHAPGLVEYLNLGKYNYLMTRFQSNNVLDIINLRASKISAVISEIVTYDPKDMILQSLAYKDNLSSYDIKGLIDVRHICERGFNGG